MKSAKLQIINISRRDIISARDRISNFSWILCKKKYNSRNSELFIVLSVVDLVRADTKRIACIVPARSTYLLSFSAMPSFLIDEAVGGSPYICLPDLDLKSSVFFRVLYAYHVYDTRYARHADEAPLFSSSLSRFFFCVSFEAICACICVVYEHIDLWRSNIT